MVIILDINFTFILNGTFGNIKFKLHCIVLLPSEYAKQTFQVLIKI